MSVDADTNSLPSISVIVPTYQEVKNLGHLIERVEAVVAEHGLDLEMWIMDDNSGDGTEELIASLDKPWVNLVVRTENRGLSPAVIDGLKAATKDILIVMDADLSHPPEKLPELAKCLESGNDFVIGSRYVPGGSTDAEWGLFRWLNSKIATLMARPFTTAKDPMAGFFAMRRAKFQEADYLNPVGYKIGLELIVKCGCSKLGEIPIYFQDRQHGESKLSFAEQMRYIQHLRRLWIYKYPTWSHILQFGVVGSSGVFVNLIVLTILELAGLSVSTALAGGIAMSVVSNFVLNRRFTFSYARAGSILIQFLKYVGACSIGMVVQFVTSKYIHGLLVDDQVPLATQISALCGIAAGMVFNFIMSRFFVFRKDEDKV